MNYGIVDLGSNTVRLSIYQCEAGQTKLLLNRKVVAGLAGYVEHGELTDDGISIACDILQRYVKLLDNLGIHAYSIFATASLRNVSNTAEAVDEILSRTGLHVDVISGKEEARLSFLGAVGPGTDKSGMLVDIGGGSAELVYYQQGAIQNAFSLPMGSLSLYTRYVSDLLPTGPERRAIRAHVKSAIYKRIEDIPQYESLLGVGGTVRAACKAANVFFGRTPGTRTLTADELQELLHILKRCGKEELHQLLKAAPERVHTIVPGMLILSTVVKLHGVRQIQASACGVREGYLYSRVLSAREVSEGG